ncbi:MAG TPA: isoprenylcysteine carboxylmethyltransferase family protein [Anaerolineales bacterium]|nr:isoprenylcysteine carboxylmethyltransferase family protein [Anaerolineales bacterium]
MFWLILVIVVWGVVHSIMASLGFKNLLQRTFGDGVMRFYRLLYNVFSALSFFPILYMMVVLPNRDLYQVSSPWNYLMLVGQGLSVLMLIIAVLQTDTLAFIGLRQIVTDDENGKLVTDGLYRFIRHPLYTFGLLILWLTPSMTINSLIVYISLTIYILVGAYFEERKLLRVFGQEYADYKAATPMLIPGLKFGGNK